MEAFTYKNQHLYCDEIKIADIADIIETPFYCYNAQHIIDHYNMYRDAFSAYREKTLIAYAVKANSNQAIISLLRKQGSGADIVSLGELKRCLHEGMDPDKIVFSGVGKTVPEIDMALKVGIHCFNVESIAELDLISQRACELGLRAKISVRINPDVDARTHPKIATGLTDSKFGVDVKQAMLVYNYATQLKNIDIIGIDVHIGSQIIDLACFEEAFKITAEFIHKLNRHGINLQHIDIGGGLGIDYSLNANKSANKRLINHYAQLALEIFAPMGLKIIVEPGRSIVGNSGILVTKIIYNKQNSGKNFVIVDAAMNDLIRPTLYNAEQQIIPIFQEKDRPNIIADIVGPVCETGDYLAQSRKINLPHPGDLLAVLGAGAYGASMSSTYNSRLLVPEVLVWGDKLAIIRKRQNYKDLIDLDSVPPWL